MDTVLLIAFVLHPHTSLSGRIHSESYRYVLDSHSDSSTSTEITSFLLDTLSLNITVDLRNDLITLRKQDPISDLIQLPFLKDDEWDEITTISPLHHIDRSISFIENIPFESDGIDSIGSNDDIMDSPNTQMTHSSRSLLQQYNDYGAYGDTAQTSTTVAPTGNTGDDTKKKKKPPPKPKAFPKKHVVASQHMIHTKIFTAFPSAKTWENAETFCRAKGGHLAAIHSPLQNEQVYKLCKGIQDSSACWIGLHRSGHFYLGKEHKKPFRWSDAS